MDRLALFHDLLGKFFPELCQKIRVFGFLPQVVRKHHRDFINDGIVSATFRTKQSTIHDDVVFHVDLEKL